MQPSKFQIERAYRYLEWMTDRLYADFEPKLLYGHKATRHGKAGSNHTFGGVLRCPRLHQLTFGTHSIVQAFQQGFREYKTIAWTLGGRTFWGWRSLHQTALHEFAHVLQSEVDGGRTRGSVHNIHFAKQYLELMRAYPADTYIDLWLVSTHQPEEIASLAHLTANFKGAWPPVKVGSDPRAHSVPTRADVPRLRSMFNLAPLNTDRIIERDR